MGPIRDATQAAQALETCLLRQLIDASGVFKGSGGTSGSQIHSQMFVEALADAVEKGGGIGLARLIENSLPAESDDLAQANGELSAEPALNTSQGRVDLPVSKSPMGEGDRP
jgi:serine/threonine protein phosphatase PrpC